MTQSSYSIGVASRQNVDIPLPADLRFEPMRWSWNCIGGPQAAEIAVYGNLAALKELRRWLRYAVTIHSNTGSALWWGYVNEVEIQANGLTIVTSLAKMCNRVNVFYATTNAGGGAAESGWISNTESIAEYGYKELIQSIGDASPTVATAAANHILTKYARPTLSRTVGGSKDVKAILRCKGWYQRLGWKYYQRVDGRVENIGEAESAIQPIGWGLSGVYLVGMGGNAIQCLGDYLNWFSKGHRLVVTGCSVSANNQTYTVSGSTSEEVVTHTDTLSFEIDDINDGNHDLEGFKEEHWLWVQNSVQNNRWHWIGKADADHIEVKQQIAGELDPEGPTSGVLLTQPQKISVDETNYTEDPSYSAKSITHKGFRVFQKVTLATGMYVSNVFLWLGKTGTTADNLNVEIYTDVAGTPTTLKTSGTVAGISLLADTVEETSVAVTRTWLAAGDYDIILWRSGGLDAANHFLVGMSTESYLTTKQWDGSAWTAIEPAWSVRFRLWGVDDIGTIAETLIAASSQDLTVSTGFLAGVDDYTYMESPANAQDALDDLLSIGDANWKRLTATCSQDMTLTLGSKDDQTAVPNLNLYSTSEGVRFLDSSGAALEPGRNVAGQWVVLGDLDDDFSAEVGLSPAWIDTAEYDTIKGTWTVAFEGDQSVNDLFLIQQG